MSGILAGLFEKRYHPSQTPPGWLTKFGGWETTSGAAVTVDTALQVMAVFGCVRVLAETLASLPLIVYRRREGGGKDRAPEHPLYRILHDLPNEEMTSYNLRETLMGHAALTGNAYAEIEWSRGGRVLGLWPLNPTKMKRIFREGGRLKYEYALPDGVGGDKKFDMSQIFHVRGLGANGIVGYNQIQLARNAVGLTMATEEHGSRFFGNGARPGIALTHPTTLSDKAYDRLKTNWEQRHQGLERAHRVAILEEGMTIQQIGVAPEDAQFLETRKFQIGEIARMFRVPPHMIADLDRATFSNIEHLSLEFVIYTMLPWFTNWEQEIQRSLLSETERKTIYAAFLVDGLLRGDTTSRYQAYSVGRQWGWLSANDIREKEDMNPIEDGDLYLTPLNMVPAGSLEEIDRSNDRFGADQAGDDEERSQAAAERPGGEAENRAEAEERESRARAKNWARKRHRIMVSYRRLYRETLRRIYKREYQDVMAAARKLYRESYAQFNLWLEDFYREHADWIMRQMRPVAEAYGDLIAIEAQEEVGEPGTGLGESDSLDRFTRSYIGGFAARSSAESVGRVRDTIREAEEENEDALEALDEEMGGWTDSRAENEGQNEAVRFGSALALMVYVLAGRQFLRWVSFGESCPYCESLDGRVAAINEWFIKAGEDYQPEGAERPLTVSHNVRHAPAHDGCDCMISAG